MVNRIKPDNEQIYYIIDAINDAINAGKQISFQYYDYTGLKKKVLKNKGEIYKLSPYKLLWNGDNYYVIGYSEKKSKVINFRVDRIASKPEMLDKDIIPIIDNGIVVRDNNWSSPHWNGKTYDRYDKKYDVIKEKFDLERVSDVLWLKFTDKGHLAVVAKSCDINWDSEQSCGLLVQEIEESFDTSFVFVFPLTRQMIRTKAEPNSFYRKYSSEELECAVGNYLISKGVPVIDYFSHMGYKYDI